MQIETIEPPQTGGVRFMTRTLGVLVAILLFVMMTLTFVDVIGRYFFNSPVKGSYELTEVLLAVSVFAALPLTTLRREHVTVSLVDRLFRGVGRVIQQLLIGVVSVVLLAGMAWRLGLLSQTLAEYDDRTLFLQIPLAWVGYFMTAMTALTALVALGLLVCQLLPQRNH